jgi:hypothetical protein
MSYEVLHYAFFSGFGMTGIQFKGLVVLNIGKIRIAHTLSWLVKYCAS